MLSHRLRRWPNIKTLGYYLMFAVHTHADLFDSFHHCTRQDNHSYNYHHALHNRLR